MIVPCLIVHLFQEGPDGVKRELGFAYFYWDLPIFSLGKWDLDL